MIPLARHLHLGSHGRDVSAVQRALRAAGFRNFGPTGTYGKNTRNEVREFKRHHNIDHEVGYGPKAHKALWPFFSDKAIEQYRAAYNHLRVDHIANAVIAAAMYGYHNNGVIHYTQDGRRMTDFAPPPNVPNYTDCSGFATWCYKSGGAPDPNGFGYNGYGFTGTMIQNGHVITTPQKACLVFYGHPVDHVAIYVGSGRIVSHGSEAGPLLLDLNYRGDYNHMRRYF